MEHFLKRDGLIVIHRRPSKENFFKVGSIHMSKLYGPFEIININPVRGSNGAKLFDIKFLITGYVLERVRRDHIKDGYVKDHTYDINVIGKTFTSKSYGDFKVLYESSRTSHNIMYRIKFLATGYEYDAWLSSIRAGEVVDPLYPRVAGVGYLGVDYKKYRNEDRELYDALKNRWIDMIRRCYAKNGNGEYVRHRYGGAGVTVDERWHCFCNFIKDVKKLPGYNRDLIISNNIIQLDKDKLQEDKPLSERLYSKDTCCWLSPQENTAIAMYEKYYKQK